MKKARFVIVGSGWRSSYYARIAKALPDRFELTYMLCRSQEKAEKMAGELGISTTTSISDCIDSKPDFVVVAVTKSSMTEVALDWLERGFYVLAETPAALNLESLERLKNLGEEGRRLIIAEQYRLYPENTAILALLKKGLIGEVSAVNISLAHEYHGASLIRAFLNLSPEEKFSVQSKTYLFPTTETLTRYEKISDGRVADKKRTVATFEFENGKVAFYDFDSEQYRSPIRKNTLKIQGVRGEIIDNKVYFLDQNNEGRESQIQIESRLVKRDRQNPNFQEIEEVEKITFEGEILYQAPFGLCGLSQDETAIASLMYKTYLFSKSQEETPYSLEESIQDSYMAIMMGKN